eukprot:928846_1
MDLEQRFVSDNFNFIDQIHPDYHPDKADRELYDLDRQQAVITLKRRWWNAQKIKKEIDETWKSKLVLDVTDDWDLTLQSHHGCIRMCDAQLTNRVNLDGTWTKVYGSNGILYDQIIFYHIFIPAPSIEYTGKCIMIGAALTSGKDKERYARIAGGIKSNTESEQGYNLSMDNIANVSSDFEWSLYTEFIANAWTLAVAILCFFHFMQSMMKKVSVKFF